jgi:hypothetical protein
MPICASHWTIVSMIRHLSTGVRSAFAAAKPVRSVQHLGRHALGVKLRGYACGCGDSYVTGPWWRCRAARAPCLHEKLRADLVVGIQGSGP